MGELTGTFGSADSPEVTMQRDRGVDTPPEKVKTHVDGVFADAVNKKDNLPVFKVSHQEFFQNMMNGRQRIRFKTGTNPQKFMQGSKYKQSFWVQHEKDGYMRKIK
jgi:hypothetical protein